MDIEKSRNGFYTVTFLNKDNLEDSDILQNFSSVGKVWGITQNFNRIFVRYKNKKAAANAIAKFGSIYKVEMAKNKSGENHQSEPTLKDCSERYQTSPSSSTLPGVTQPKQHLNSESKMFHLILGNLPKNFTTKDVRGLVEEVKPVSINELNKTKVFQLKFCHVVLDSFQNLSYLIKKLDGFTICGQKLIAAEAERLLEWRQREV